MEKQRRSLSQKLLRRIRHKCAEIWGKDLFIPLSPLRQLARKHEAPLDLLSSKEALKVGNYFLTKKTMLDSNSCIYSCGVGWDVDFEKAIFNLFGSSSYLFDPTPESQNYINRYHSQSSYINFEAIGVWDKDETLDFYEPKRGGSSTVSLMTEKTHNYLFKAPCLKISSIMKRLNHSHIDLLKLDIEGAATRVLNQCFLDGVFPDTIVAEFEYNLNSENQCVQSVEEVNNTLEKAQEHGYKVFRLPRKDRRYLCIEVLLLR